jgi:endonuclease G
VTLNIDSQGNVSVAGSGSAAEAAMFEAKPKKEVAERAPAFDVAFDSDYSNRSGYLPTFLGDDVVVHLPTLSSALKHVASKLINAASDDDYVLRYHNYSVVIHSERRFAIYSAANVRYSDRYKMSRPGDVWRTDPRIPQEHQVSNFYYKGNKFDRGHLTRREDLEFGKTAADALASAADTCHWTNCTPQHAKFNQNKQLWQGLEGFVLESGLLQGKFDVQVFTGPILEEDDPVHKPFPKIQFPVRFWKVLVAVDADGQLFATAYILDQTDVIAQFGIEEAAPYGEYQTFQVAVAEVERLTTLTFTGELAGELIKLRDHDPFTKAKGKAKRTPATTRTAESAELGVNNEYRPLRDLDDVLLG